MPFIAFAELPRHPRGTINSEGPMPAPLADSAPPAAEPAASRAAWGLLALAAEHAALRKLVLQWIEGAEAWPIGVVGDRAGPACLIGELAVGPYERLRLWASGEAAPLASIVAQLEDACRRQLAAEEAVRRLVGETLADAGRLALFCTPSGRLVYDAPPKAPGVLHLRHGRLAAVQPHAEFELRRAIRAAALSADRTNLVLADCDGRRTVVEVKPALGDLGRLRPLALIVLADRPARQAPHPGLLKDAFGFTPSEAEVAGALARGLRVRAIAEQRGVAVSTVRSQAKTILAKLGVSGQAELVHRLAGVC